MHVLVEYADEEPHELLMLKNEQWVSSQNLLRVDRHELGLQPNPGLALRR